MMGYEFVDYLRNLKGYEGLCRDMTKIIGVMKGYGSGIFLLLLGICRDMIGL